MSTLTDTRVASTLDRMSAASREQVTAPDAGKLLYSLVRATRPETAVEFGMSMAAVRDNGTGRVVTTELTSEQSG